MYLFDPELKAPSDPDTHIRTGLRLPQVRFAAGFFNSISPDLTKWKMNTKHRSLKHRLTWFGPCAKEKSTFVSKPN